MVKGSYRDGLRTGMWYTYSLVKDGNKTDSLVMFKGNLLMTCPMESIPVLGQPEKFMTKGFYVMGKKEGDWMINNSERDPVSYHYIQRWS